MTFETLLGGHPFSVFIRLVVLSIIVGIVLSAFGLDPLDLLNSLKILVLRIYELGFSAFDWLLAYFLLGAAIVVPIWLVMRLFSVSGHHNDPKDKS
ncbi:MAG: DUF6460 domain-containing protein [Pseudomonadota bacterium]